MNAYSFTVNMLGEFQVFLNGELVNQRLARSKKANNLLEYLLYNRRLVSTSELHEVFWAQVSNPKNALKVLVHRLRLLLIECGIPEELDCIVQRNGGYEWNPALATTVDIDLFEACYQEAMSGKMPAPERIPLLERALSLYRGRFSDGGELWMTNLSQQLHNAYKSMVQMMCTLYKENGQLEQLVALCRAALVHDPIDEALHRQLIVGLLACGQHEAARSHYRYVTDLYYNRLGISVSEELHALYQHMVSTDDNSDMDIEGIREILEEKTPRAGAFICEYSIFKDLYRIEARCLGRYGGRVFLALLKVVSANGDQLSPRGMERQMELLLKVASGSLRKGDIIAQFSPSQYVILLPTVTHETGLLVLDRIRSNFRRAHPKSPIVILGKLRPLKPVDELPQEEMGAAQEA